MKWLLNLFYPATAPQPAAPKPAVPRSAIEDLLTLMAAPVDVTADRPEWPVEYQAELVAFLRRDSGKRMLELLRFNEETLKTNACDEQQKRVDHARGQAIGYRAAMASLIVLSAPPTPSKSEETAEPQPGSAEAMRDQLASP